MHAVYLIQPKGDGGDKHPTKDESFDVENAVRGDPGITDTNDDKNENVKDPITEGDGERFRCLYIYLYIISSKQARLFRLLKSRFRLFSSNVLIDTTETGSLISQNLDGAKTNAFD